MRIGQFRNDAARTKFITAYDRVFTAVWPLPRWAVDVPTAFGTTRVYRGGPSEGPPVVLLPGAGGNALSWYGYAAALAAHHPVIVVDPVGEPGASVQTAPVADGPDAGRWLDQLLAGLDVTDAHVVGCSYGGWTALHAVLAAPGRVARLTLVEPAGFAEVGARFIGWIIAGGLAGLAPRALRPRLARLVGNSTILETELMSLALPSAGFRRKLPPATVFTDEELRAVGVPVSVLLGARSTLHRSAQVAARLADVAPGIRVEVVPGAGHALQLDRSELVIDRILGNVAAGR
ncbi:carboxylesterase [Longispora fulva]|uniref:Pimeloyl-ACP methyl ester carboxylesterase n=1 Tax=Longispora fulva TaxID=619741 RepID=A0A8J7KGG8_9ACTN|nr:alpha/beta fold hydrolase [Longispora fulva]MBG6134944.1 pimeloyl-ACP methyl ester carboxylesterase [Longispora fulva]GIG56824.1 carboxylesterase [Longispora fulva]